MLATPFSCADSIQSSADVLYPIHHKPLEISRDATGQAACKSSPPYPPVASFSDMFTSAGSEFFSESGFTLFGSLSTPTEVLARLFAFSRSCSSCRTALRASLSLRSFSRRSALDSNSCQSPCRSLSLSNLLARSLKGSFEDIGNSLDSLHRCWLFRSKVRMF